KPCLASVYLSADPGSVLYTRLKGQAAKEVGIKFLSFKINSNNVSEIISIVERLNKDNSVHGILVQKPSGSNDFKNEEWAKIALSISPQKDFDCLSPENLGLLLIGNPRFIPATVLSVLKVLEFSKVNLNGKKIVIIGTSEILGKPLSHILTDKGATVSLLHKKTSDISNYSKEADILISATGEPGIIGKDLVKENSIIIDVGAPNGDVKTEEVLGKVSFLSPVPGGVGPMTIQSLLENLINSLIEKNKLN
ncbi:bifunctional 5,10-methylenetetrahydrofolate dehydrogenase/5,10-methenyltetrahydrofolate cyclohydrolase, partial [Patescibacteria group bacterium]|nr:bifunctional 5,10-methylenetetrahydrofolate dehydrogenase/5,10-methenyltetrahydrofolate cyclohydrolase [Patescibacteria group bacterium]